MVRSFRGSVWTLAVVLTITGCSDDEKDEPGGGAGSSGAAGSTSQAGSTGYAPGEEPACRASMPHDASEVFAALAGEYVFTPGLDCAIDGVAFHEGSASSASVNASNKTVIVTPAGATSGVTFTWDGQRDLSCRGEYTQYVEIDGHGGFARIVFIGAKPSALVLPVCIGTLR